MSRPSPPTSTPPVILIVDDAVDLLEVWKLLLESSGFRVVTATNGVAGLEQAKRSKPSLIITDYMMPGMDGLTLCRNLKFDPELARIPTVMWTAARVSLADPAVDRYLLKPVFLEQLIDEIRTLSPESGPSEDS